MAIKQTREQAMAKVRAQAEESAEERILDALLSPTTKSHVDDSESVTPEESLSRQTFRKRLREKQLDDKEIEIAISALPIGVEIMAPPGMEEMTNQLQSMFQNLGTEKTRTRKMRVKDAMKALIEEEASRFLNEEDIKRQAIESVEQDGIVFIDEIDKVTRRSEYSGSGADISREGVQRDLLPLVEGSTVSTKYGAIKTNHILFIASGAFHLTKPSDLIPELQGRLPIRVELQALTAADFERILTEPSASLTEQYTALLATEGVTIQFAPDGLQEAARIAFHVNERIENIGARRLHTVMERLLELISFEASDRKGETLVIDQKYVQQSLSELVQNEDLSRAIL
jgi:ATP-dependent HslUV protease ATP-binding subunit HslU